MIGAFVFWQLWQGWHLPSWLALLLVVLVFAPLLGLVIERSLMRRLYGASIEVQIVTTLGLLVFLLGVGFILWNPSHATRYLPRFFGDRHVTVLGLSIDYHQIIIVIVSIAVAVALRLFFSRTRTGVAMRAVVDNRDLL